MERDTLEVARIAIGACLNVEKSLTARVRMNKALVDIARHLNDENYVIGDFRERELFGGAVVADIGQYDVTECNECGVAVTNRTKHTAWHNKLLP